MRFSIRHSSHTFSRHTRWTRQSMLGNVGTRKARAHHATRVRANFGRFRNWVVRRVWRPQVQFSHCDNSKPVQSNLAPTEPERCSLGLTSPTDLAPSTRTSSSSCPVRPTTGSATTGTSLTTARQRIALCHLENGSPADASRAHRLRCIEWPMRWSIALGPASICCYSGAARHTEQLAPVGQPVVKLVVS